MHSLEFEIGAFSKKTTFIAGLTVHVYNSDALEPYLKSYDSIEALKALNHADIPVNVVYLVHGRGSNYTFTESIAYVLLKQYYDKIRQRPLASQVPMVCITFDIPNHGARLASEISNSSWEKNPDHGLNMISIIDAVVEEIRLLVDFVPVYLNPDYHLASGARKHAGYEKIGVRYNTIISGYSLGGHAAIRFAAKYPDTTYAINPVCGASDLASLLLNRLRGKKDDFARNQFYFGYDELALSDEQRKIYYPEALHRHISKQDTVIFEHVPGNPRIRVFASYGTEDKLVPPEFSRSWIDMCKINSAVSDLFFADGVGHDVTVEMVDRFSTWLVKLQ